jgi:hypothetical protein
MNEYIKTFQKQGYVVVKNFISKDMGKHLFEYLKLYEYRQTLQKNEKSFENDLQVPGAFSVGHGDLIFDSLMKTVKPKMEYYTGLDLFPTYSYTRLYKPGNELKIHRDRPSCEISITVKLSDTGWYNWPIWMVDTPYNLNDGDGVIYRGCDLEHWREPCGGYEEYIMGQVFMHYVDKNGPYAEHRYDQIEYPERTPMINFFER